MVSSRSRFGLAHANRVGSIANMTEPLPDLAERLKALLRRIMREADPEEFDRQASEIWSTLDELEHRGEKKAA